jgi:uncharacterized membrane protein
MENLQTKKSIKTKNSLGIISTFAVLSLSVYFIANNLHFFRMTPEDLGKYINAKWIILLHIAGGAVALLTGPFQFWDKLRLRYKQLHRKLGWTYCIAVATSSTCAIYLSATTAFAVNWAYAFSLHIWIGVWIISSHIALMAAIRKKFILHKEWMWRSYIATLAFVVSASLLKLPVVQRLGTFEEIGASFFWLGWAVPMFLYEVSRSFKARK